LADALKWLRNKGEDDETLDPNGVFKQLDSTLQRKAGKTPEERANDLDKALAAGGDDSIPAFDAIGSSAIRRRSPEQKAKDLQDVLNLMRKGKDQGEEEDDMYGPTAEFRKLDNLLPTKRGQTPEDRTREIEGALDRLRSQGTTPDPDEATTPF
jgi:hypothetical protein